MLRHLGLIAVCACIVASVGCDGAKLTAPDPNTTAPTPPLPPSSEPIPTVTVEFGGRVVNADAGGPVGNVRVSVQDVFLGSRPNPEGWVFPKDTATSGGDGTFTLPLNLPSFWKLVYLKLTGPGYDDAVRDFQPIQTVRTGVEFRMYPTLVIRPGESIKVRVDSSIAQCGWGGEAGPCRRVLVAASSGDPVELELVPDDSSKPMALSPDDFLGAYMPVRRLMVDPGGVPFVIGAGTATLAARR